VLRKEKIKRREILTKVLIKTALEKNKKYIGKEVEVLANKKENLLKGRWESGSHLHFGPRARLLWRLF
ncbi:unnamed protein product, partial [marine sediment metagenome]